MQPLHPPHVSAPDRGWLSLPTTSKTELNARCNRCRTMHAHTTLNNRNVLQTPAHSAYCTTKCSISKQLPMLLLRFWKTNSSTFLFNSNRKTSNIRPWKDDSSLTRNSMLLSVSTRLVMILHRWKRTWWNACFRLVLLKQDKRSEGYGAQKSRNELESCHLWICFALIVGFARSANDVQVRRL